MASASQIERTILEALNTLKTRLSEVEEKPDDVLTELQVRCEGLEAFLTPFQSQPNYILKYIDAPKLQGELRKICEMVEKEGFKAKPPVYEKLSRRGVPKKDFIETVSYVLSTLLDGRQALRRNNQLPQDLDNLIWKTVEKCVNWFSEYHIEGGGWSGLAYKTTTHVYATWCAVEALRDFKDHLKTMDVTEYPQRILELSSKVDDMLDDVRSWLMAFAEKFKDGYWGEDDSPRFFSTHLAYNIYGLHLLLRLYEEGDSTGEILKKYAIREVQKIVEIWRERKVLFTRMVVHGLKYKTNHKVEVFLYEDKSLPYMTIKALSRAVKQFKNALSELTIEISTNGSVERQNLLNAVQATLEGMLNDPQGQITLKLDDLSDKLWREGKKSLSIHHVQRAIDALQEYLECVKPSEEKEHETEVSQSQQQLLTCVRDVIQKSYLQPTESRLEAIEASLKSLQERVESLQEQIKELASVNNNSIKSVIQELMEVQRAQSFTLPEDVVRELSDTVASAITEMLTHSLKDTVRESIEERMNLLREGIKELSQLSDSLLKSVVQELMKINNPLLSDNFAKQLSKSISEQVSESLTRTVKDAVKEAFEERGRRAEGIWYRK